MEIAFVILCIVGGLGVALCIGFILGKMEKFKKIPDWAISLICTVLAFGGLFAGFWFVDAYNQYIIEKEHTRQFENCKDNGLTTEQCQYFQDVLNIDL